MENLGVFLIILIFMILRGLYRQSQERAQRERQGNVRSAPRPRPTALPQAPPPKYESIFPVGPSETQTDYESEEEDEDEEEKVLWNEVESMPEEMPAPKPALSPSAGRMQEWLQKRSGESQESLELGPQSGRSKAKEEETKPPVSVTPMMPSKYRRLLENPETIRDAVVLSEIIRRPQF